MAVVIASNQQVPTGTPTPPAPGAPEPLRDVLAVLTLVATAVSLVRGADLRHVLALLVAMTVALCAHRVRRNPTCKHPKLWTLVLVAGIVACIAALLSAPRPPPAPPPDEPTPRQPARRSRDVRVGKPIAVGLRPDQLAVTGGELWIATASNVTRVDAQLGGAPRVGLAVSDAYDIAASGDRIVVIRHGRAIRFDTVTRRQIGRPVTFSEGPGHVAAGFGAAWICNQTHSKIDRWDLATGVFRPIPVPGVPADVAVGAGAVWVSLQNGGVARIDPGTHAVTTIATEEGPGAMVFGLGQLWVAHPDLRVVTRIDPVRLKEVGRDVNVGSDVRALTILGGSVWAVSAGADQVQRIDPRAGRVVKRFKVGAEPRDVVTLGDRLLVSSANESTITPIHVRMRRAAQGPSDGGSSKASRADARRHARSRAGRMRDPWPQRHGALPGASIFGMAPRRAAVRRHGPARPRPAAPRADRLGVGRRDARNHAADRAQARRQAPPQSAGG